MTRFERQEFSHLLQQPQGVFGGDQLVDLSFQPGDSVQAAAQVVHELLHGFVPQPFGHRHQLVQGPFVLSGLHVLSGLCVGRLGVGPACVPMSGQFGHHLFSLFGKSSQLAVRFPGDDAEHGQGLVVQTGGVKPGRFLEDILAAEDSPLDRLSQIDAASAAVFLAGTGHRAALDAMLPQRLAAVSAELASGGVGGLTLRTVKHGRWCGLLCHSGSLLPRVDCHWLSSVARVLLDAKSRLRFLGRIRRLSPILRPQY